MAADESDSSVDFLVADAARVASGAEESSSLASDSGSDGSVDFLEPVRPEQESARTATDTARGSAHGSRGALELCRAARAGYAREVEAIIDVDGVSTEVRDAGGLTPLMLACISDGHDPLRGPDTSEPQRKEVVQVLLERRADVNTSGPGDWTPMFWAAFYAQESILKLLLHARADVHHRDEADRGAASWLRYGEADRDRLKSALKVLAGYGYRQHVEVLVKQGLVSNEFHSPIELDDAAKAVLAADFAQTASRKAARSPKTSVKMPNSTGDTEKCFGRQ